MADVHSGGCSGDCGGAGSEDAMAAAAHEMLMAAVSAQLVESGKSKLMTKDKYDRIVLYLLDPSSCTEAHFRHWVKGRGFSVVDLPVYGLRNVLKVPRAARKGDVGRQDGELLRVVHQDELYSVVEFVHNVHSVHAGYKKVLAKVEQEFYGISRNMYRNSAERVQLVNYENQRLCTSNCVQKSRRECGIVYRLTSLIYVTAQMVIIITLGMSWIISVNFMYCFLLGQSLPLKWRHKLKNE